MIQTHADFLKSNATGVPVMGITLTRLTTKKNRGGHAMIKIGIEGGGYKLLEEAIRRHFFANWCSIPVGCSPSELFGPGGSAGWRFQSKQSRFPHPT
jgi:hypothetical protein